MMGFADWRNKKKAVTDSGKSAAASVESGFMPAGSNGEIFTYHAKVPQLDLGAWYGSNAAELQSMLEKHGALLFRGFALHQKEHFKGFVDAALPQTANYIEGATPRTQLQEGIYTSTEFPEAEEIAPHNELSYVSTPPNTLAFCCIDAATTGGQTQIVDVAKVYQSLEPSLVDEFERRGGWMLVRNYGYGFGPSVQKAFGEQDIEKIKQYCQKANVEMTVMGDDKVSTRQVRAAVHRHPKSGVPLWFNHVAFWHPSSLCPKVREQMETVLNIEEFPYCTYYGDGTAIPDEVIARIRQAYREHERLFDWRHGDVMLLDNWQVAHGRKPFSGDRLVLVAMG